MKLRLALAVVVLVVAACSGAATASEAPPGSPAPSGAPASGAPEPSAPGPGAVGSEEEAAEAVRATNPLFASIGPLDPDLIGQAHWWEAVETDDGWEVIVRVGWGDCPAGCISEHVWTYEVGRDGRVALVGESGEPVPPEVQAQLLGS